MTTETRSTTTSLDVLYSTQDVKHPGIAPVHRGAFRPVAKDIASERQILRLYDVTISRDNFITPVKVLLALQFQPPVETEAGTGTGLDLSQFDAAADAVTIPFCQPISEMRSATITWPSSNRMMRDVVPYLFDPVYHMLSTAFLNKPGPGLMAGSMDGPETSLDGALTLPRLSQLATILAGSVYFGSLYQVHHYSSENLPKSSAELISAMQAVTGEAAMIVSMKSGDISRVYGVFSPKPRLDGASVQTNAIPGHIDQRDALSSSYFRPRTSTKELSASQVGRF
ncbi:Restriction of telomere capping protein 5 [Madurella mycetomatis]|uniref:Restriction of telomere capping protein 5 n=1 Tax=Madurella mycetomatis TaxID=100816 RepID=A0A175VPT7_9PEZI|nr:Restriction of telomere capping protein 5 [Madurella mycetomatis]KXX73101.1 Restriction of telomere capping protein 5 [Madurella mycetomatis]